jgi:hypothetical protein
MNTSDCTEQSNREEEAGTGKSSTDSVNSGSGPD